MTAKIKKLFYGIFDYHKKVKEIEIHDDILLSIFAFLTQPQCCQLELVTFRWHRLICIIGNGLKMIHLVKTPILLLKIYKNSVSHCNKKTKFGFFPWDAPKRKLPDPPNYVRCRHLRLKCTEMLAADFLAANSHIFNFPIYPGQNIGTSVQISADFTTEAYVWPKLFSTFHAVDSLEFYLTEKPSSPAVRALNELKKKEIAKLRKELKCSKKNDHEFVEGCQNVIKKWRIQICQHSDGNFGPTVEQMAAWLNCTCRAKVGGLRELFFGNATELMPGTIRQLLQQNFHEFLNEESSVDNKMIGNNNRGSQRTVVIWVLSNLIREMIEQYSAAAADQNLEQLGQIVGQWIHFANRSTAANCRLKMEESHRGLSGELIMVQERH